MSLVDLGRTLSYQIQIQILGRSDSMSLVDVTKIFPCTKSVKRSTSFRITQSAHLFLSCYRQEKSFIIQYRSH